MFPRNQIAFQPLVNSSSPSFSSSAMGTTSFAYALESTALNRTWQGPTSRSVRLNAFGSTAYFVQFGSSLVLSESTNSMLVVGPGPEIFSVDPKQTYIAIVSSTSAVVNVTLGVGK